MVGMVSSWWSSIVAFIPWRGHDAQAQGEGVEQRMRAAERLLDRVFGRPKQSAELSGTLSIDERRLEAEVEEELAALVAARERNVALLAGGNGDGGG